MALQEEWLKEIDNKISNHRGEQYKKLEDEMDELRKNRIKKIDEQIKLLQRYVDSRKKDLEEGREINLEELT